MLYSRVRQMIDGKSEGEIKDIAFNIARERGIDLSKFAGQLGLKI